MTNNMCDHGYTFGMCPKGCQESTSDAPMPIPALEEIHPPVHHEVSDKLKCVICGQEVQSGKVYKGKPICDPCMDGMKGEKAEPPEVPKTPEG